jgi:predicted nucleic acid-binding protein
MTRAAGKHFIDTNIFVYTFDTGASDKRRRARQIVAAALANREGVISWQVVQEFLDVATRKFEKPMSVSRALSLAGDTGFAFYDALIVTSAASAGCNIILTEDLQHGRRISGVEIRNPFT